MEGEKLQAARAAALIFVGLLDLSPTGDQVAVVRFDADAELLAGLGADSDRIRSALDGLHTRIGTHIDAVSAGNAPIG